MGKYGQIAIEAARLAQKTKDPVGAWEVISSQIFGKGTPSQLKGCPRNTFLGLCSEGKLKEIPVGNYTRSKKNKIYGLKALELLSKNTSFLDPSELWIKVLQAAGEDLPKQHNEQMDVVIALWGTGLFGP